MNTCYVRVLCICISLSLGGCGIQPIQYAGTPTKRCSAISHRISIDPPQGIPVGIVKSEGFVSPVEQRDPLAAAIVESYRQAADKSHRASVGEEPISPSMLFLSGGSQNGAFGAGLLSDWARARSLNGNGPELPRFRVVTGISTGALQATFAFLDEPEEIVRRYSINHERELLKVLAPGGFEGGGIWGKLRAGKTIATKGTLGELEPLRGQLRDLVDKELLEQIAAESRAGRFLLVGAVEMDSGDAYAFDLTEAAVRYEAGDESMRDCYIEALIASSSVPMAAKPVFIDGKMYIDGGARFGVLSDELAAIFEAAALNLAPGEPRNLFVIVNGTLEAGTRCHLGDEDGASCPDETDAAGNPAHPKWSFDKLAFRSLSILINQSYRSSVYWATDRAKDRGFKPYLARINADKLSEHLVDVKFPNELSAKRSCKEWKQIDKEIEKPLEFHPRFMRCEIDYGRKFQEEIKWAGME